MKIQISETMPNSVILCEINLDKNFTEHLAKDGAKEFRPFLKGVLELMEKTLEPEYKYVANVIDDSDWFKNKEYTKEQL